MTTPPNSQGPRLVRDDAAQPSDPIDVPPPPMAGERRRAGWREFRHAYPGFVAAMTAALLAFAAIDGWLLYRQHRYRTEEARLRSGMSGVERQRVDASLATQTNRLAMQVELIRRQAGLDKRLHLAVMVDSGTMFLEREGARLRAMRVTAGPERMVAEGGDSIPIAVPRGSRTVERILQGSYAWEVPAWAYRDRGLAAPADRSVPGALGPVAIELNGGIVLYSMPSGGPLNDSSYVLPGSIRARADDLRAILPNLQRGMSVYFY